MRALARGLLADLAAGARLALFLPVRRLAFRVGLAELLALFVVSALVQIGADALRFGADATFSWYGLGNEVFSGGLLLLTSAVLALVNRDRALATAIPTIVLASFPILQLANSVSWTRFDVPAGVAVVVDTALLVWIVAVLVRSVHVALEYRRVHRPYRAVAGGLLLAWPIFFAPAFGPVEPWFTPGGLDAADSRYPSAASEPVLASAGDAPRGRAVVAGGRACRRHRPVLRRRRRGRDRGRVPRRRRGGAAGDGRALGDGGALGRSRQQSAHARRRADRDAHEPARLARRDRRGDGSRTRTSRWCTCRRAAIRTARSADCACRRSSSCRSRPPCCGRVRRRRHPLPDRRRVGVPRGGVRRRARRRRHGRHRGVDVRDRGSSGCDRGSVATAFGEAFFQRGMAKASGLAEAFDLARAGRGARALRELRRPDQPAHARRRRHRGQGRRAARRRSGSAQIEARRRGAPVG